MVALLSLALPLSPRAVKALKSLFAQVAAGGALQERLDRGARQRHDRLAGHAALFGRSPGGGDKAVRQARAVVLAELHEPLLLVAEQMVAEAGAEMGQPLVDLGHPLLLRPRRARRRRGGSAYRSAPAAASARRSRPSASRFSCSIGDAAEQHGVHHDRIPVPRHPKRHLLVDLQDRRIGVGRDQVVEHRRDLGEQLARALQRRDGVGEVGRRRIVGDRGDLGRVVGEGLLEGRQEVLGRDRVEGRGLERRLPGLEQRVVAACFRGSRCRIGFPTSQNPVFRRKFTRDSISRDAAFLGLLRL